MLLGINKSLGGIEQELKTIFFKLDELNSTLHGNGRAGLVERVTELEAHDKSKSKLLEWGAIIVTAITAVYSAFFKHGGN